MASNLITFGRKSNNLVLCLEKKTIGSFLTTFKDYIKKDHIVYLHCNSQIFARAKVSSNYFFSEQEIWPDKLYPHRFYIDDVKCFETPLMLNNGVYNSELRARFGSGWAYKFLFSPQPLPNDIASQLDAELSKKKTILAEDLKTLIARPN